MSANIEEEETATATESWFDFDNERLDCEHLDEMTDWRMGEHLGPSFITHMLRFFGNVVVDIIRAILYY